MPKRQSLTGSNTSSHCSETGCSEAGCSKAGCSKAGHSKSSYLELEADRASPVPSKEASEDCLEVASDGGIQDQGHFNFQQDQVDEVVRNPLQNHDRMDSGRRYCLLITVHEATRRGCQALPKAKWNPAGIVDMMRDDLDVTEVVILDHIATILFVGRQNAGKGLTEEEAEACIKHFSPYVEWREVAIEREFQALTLAEGREEIQAYDAQSQKSLQEWGRPRVAKPPSPIPGKIPMG